MRSFKRTTLNKAGDSNKFTAFSEDDAQKRIIKKLQKTPVDTNVYSVVDKTGVAGLYNMQTTSSSLLASKSKPNPPAKVKSAASKPPGKYFCSHADCALSFASAKELRKHKLSHRVRKHKCHVEGCDRAFFEKSKLTRHQTVHDKTKSYPCPFCPKMFGYKANVKTHILTHLGKKPFACSYPGCTRSFTQASNCKVHEKTHLKKKGQATGRKRKRVTNPSANTAADTQEPVQVDKVARGADVIGSLSVRNLNQVEQSAAASVSGMNTPLSFNPAQLDEVSLTDSLLGDDLFSPEGSNLFPKINGETWFGDVSQQAPPTPSANSSFFRPSTLKNSVVSSDSFYAEKDNIDLHRTSIDSGQFEPFRKE